MIRESLGVFKLLRPCSNNGLGSGLGFAELQSCYSCAVTIGIYIHPRSN